MPAACASGHCRRVRRRTHQTQSTAVALTVQSDLLRIYNSDRRLVPLSLQRFRNMRVQRPLNHRSGWPGDWCALNIATTPEQTSHVLFKLTEFHHASSASSPRVLRKVIPASSDENRGQDLMVNTKLTLLATARNSTPGGRQCGSSCGQRSEACVVSLLKSTCCERATPPSCGENATRHQRATTSRKSDRAVASPPPPSPQEKLCAASCAATKLLHALFGIEECTQVELKKANQQMCLQQSARSKAEQPKSELSCCAERPSGAPRASAAVRHTHCLPLSCATTRI